MSRAASVTTVSSKGSSIPRILSKAASSSSSALPVAFRDFLHTGWTRSLWGDIFGSFLDPTRAQTLYNPGFPVSAIWMIWQGVSTSVLCTISRKPPRVIVPLFLSPSRLFLLLFPSPPLFLCFAWNSHFFFWNLIQATKPLNFFGGHHYLYYFLVEMFDPGVLEQLFDGHMEYLAMSHRNWVLAWRFSHSLSRWNCIRAWSRLWRLIWISLKSAYK